MTVGGTSGAFASTGSRRVCTAYNPTERSRVSAAAATPLGRQYTRSPALPGATERRWNPLGVAGAAITSSSARGSGANGTAQGAVSVSPGRPDFSPARPITAPAHQLEWEAPAAGPSGLSSFEVPPTASLRVFRSKGGRWEGEASRGMGPGGGYGGGLGVLGHSGSRPPTRETALSSCLGSDDDRSRPASRGRGARTAGALVPPSNIMAPRIYTSHLTADQVLPVLLGPDAEPLPASAGGGSVGGASKPRAAAGGSRPSSRPSSRGGGGGAPAFHPDDDRRLALGRVGELEKRLARAQVRGCDPSNDPITLAPPPPAHLPPALLMHLPPALPPALP